MKNRIIVYCAGGIAERIYFSLNDESNTVIAVADGNPAYSKGAVSYDEIPIIPSTDIVKLEYDYIIVALDYHFYAIKGNLMEMGVPEEKILVFQYKNEKMGWYDERISQLRKCLDTIKVRHIEGQLAELGVYQGDFAQYLNRYLPDRRLYLFDTFEGFDADHDVVEETDRDNFKNTSVNLVLSKMINTDNVIVKKGYFPSTAEDIPADERFALVSLDCDLYEPMISGLNYFYERLVSGGYIFVHDFGNRHYPGARKAVLEFCEKQGVSYFPIMDQYLSVIFTK